MKYQIEEIKNKILCGDCLEILRKFPSDSIDMVIFSPPYWGLRRNLSDDDPNKKYEIGLESSFEEYMDKMIEVMKEIKRVMKPTGTCWVNFGNAYGSHSIGQGNVGGIEGKRAKKNPAYKQAISAMSKKSFVPNFGKEIDTKKSTIANPESNLHRGRAGHSKCLLMMPERFAIRCIDEVGLILRNSIIWAKQVLFFNKDGSKYTKGSVMPTSTYSRFNQSFEYLFFFVKNNKTILWRNEKTKEWIDKKPLGIDGIEGKDWEWDVCYNTSPDCKTCQGTGQKKVSLWKGYSYWCDLDAVRLPPQTSIEKLFKRIDYDMNKRGGKYNSEEEISKYQQEKLKAYPEGQRGHIKFGGINSPEGQRRYWEKLIKAREEIEAYKQETEKIKGGGANLNLLWNPITGGKIYQRNWRQEEAKKQGMHTFYSHSKRFKPGEYQGKVAGREDAELFNSPRAKTQRKKTIIDPNAKGLRQAPEPGEPNAFHPFGKNIPTVWLINPEPHSFKKELGEEVAEHFSIFPEKLLEVPILFGCPPGGIVLDPFMGSGTTAIVAKKLGRNFIGIELNKQYCGLARKRILKEAPDTLFDIIEKDNAKVTKK